MAKLLYWKDVFLSSFLDDDLDQLAGINEYLVQIFWVPFFNFFDQQFCGFLLCKQYGQRPERRYLDSHGMGDHHQSKQFGVSSGRRTLF